MPKLNLQRYPIGILDWDLNPIQIEDLLEPHDSLEGYHRYCLELKQSPSKFWSETDRYTPIKMWSDGTHVRGKSSFHKNWCGLPEYILAELLRSFKAYVLIAQVQAEYDQLSHVERFFEGDPEDIRPKYVNVKLVIYTDYEIESPTYFLASYFRKWWRPKGAYSEFCSIKEQLASYSEEETRPEGEFISSWEELRQKELIAERTRIPPME